MSKTYTAAEIAAIINTTVIRVYALARAQSWPYQTIKAKDSRGHTRQIKHFDAGPVDAYLSTRKLQPEPSGYPNRMMAVAVSDDEYQQITKQLTTRERGEAMLEKID